MGDDLSSPAVVGIGGSYLGRIFYRLGIPAISENGCADHRWVAGRHRRIGRYRLD